MVKLLVDLKDVIGATHPSDHVKVWVPAHREGPNGETLAPRPVKIELENGVGEEEVAPGPLVIDIIAHDARQDTRAKQVVIPDQASITLAEALADAFVWEPPVVSRVGQDAAAAKRARDEAEAARAQAVAAAGTYPYIGPNGNWWIVDTDTGVVAEGQDGELTPEVLATIEQAAVDAAAEATNTSVEASALAVLAATVFDQLIDDGMPEGVVAAPVGTIYTDRQATAGAVKWIKVSGTGTTGWQVLWANTGLRKLVTFHTDGTLTNHGGASDPAGFTSYNDNVEGGLWVRRANQKVIYYLRGRIATEGQVIRLPSGMRPDGNPYPVTTIPYSSTASQNAAVGGNAIYMTIPTGVAVPSLGGAYTATITFDTYLPWPTTLPGIPDD